MPLLGSLCEFSLEQTARMKTRTEPCRDYQFQIQVALARTDRTQQHHRVYGPPRKALLPTLSTLAENAVSDVHRIDSIRFLHIVQHLVG
eukprot:4033665-Amphidinium_carterae.1